MRTDNMKILFIGDIVGSCGKNMALKSLRKWHSQEKWDMVIANGENIADHNGINRALFDELSFGGIDVVTMGNHTWDNREIMHFIDDTDRLIRPLNYPPGTPGSGYTLFDMGKYTIAVINLLGNVYINTLPSPFAIIDQTLATIKAQGIRHIIIDLHAEATAEKIAFGYYLDGQVSAVIGTHTHVQTADEKILPQGTAYITDVGMTGPYHSVIGVQPQLSVQRFATQLPVRFEQAQGVAQFNAVLITLDDQSGMATQIQRLNDVEF